MHLIWVMALSLMYYGVKGGFLTLLTAGTKKISGPGRDSAYPETTIIWPVALLVQFCPSSIICVYIPPTVFAAPWADLWVCCVLSLCRWQLLSRSLCGNGRAWYRMVATFAQ